MAKKHIDRAALIATIRELKELSNEQKSDILQLISEQKKYGIVWEDSPEDVEENLRVNVPVLVEDKDRAIISNADDAPNHILIEGDNLEALTALSYTHEGKIDVIYIDPPYNTGNKDFVYNDSFVDSEDGYRHSKWLSFMEKRLKIAKKLLSDKGVIFISIDDNEQANLKLLCDDVLGYTNYITTFIWKSTPGSNTGTDIKTVTEYILLYSRNKNLFIPNTRIINDNTKYSLSDEYVNRRGNYILNKLDRRMTGSHYSDALNYAIKVPDGTMLYPGSSENKIEHWNWRWSKQKVEWGIENGFIVFKENKGIWSIYFKQYQNVDNNDNLIVRALPYQNLLDDDDSFNSARGSADLMAVLCAKKFDYPKPLSLVQRTITIASHKDSIILDFFAGSGTTLHATMQLNAEDGGHRQCILCTNNENNICEEVTYERNKRVINGYTTPKDVEVEGLHDNSLRYYKIKDVPRDSSTTGLKKLMLASTDLLCIKNDLYEEKSLFGNIKLRKHIARYFDDDKQKMLIIYKVDAIESIVEEIKKMPADTFIKVYVFSTTNYAMDADFEDVSDKVFLCALPAAIYNAYRKVLPRKNNVITEEEEE
jgi:adenine-specific DNA-methyltransferase